MHILVKVLGFISSREILMKDEPIEELKESVSPADRVPVWEWGSGSL